MIVYEAPNEWPGWTAHFRTDRCERPGQFWRAFLAGGITGCPDWQAEAIDHLANTNLALFNPRRADFPIDNPDAAQAQIEWEHRNLHLVDRILFWFPKETLCPIALYELGAWTRTNKPMVIGIEPGYAREQDIRIQTRLERPSVPVTNDLADACDLLQSGFLR